MQPAFNPYRQWLGLPLDHGAPNHYELLNLAAGEGDPKQIALAAEQAATKVRSFRPGDQAVQWARLLDEIQQARLTLLDPQRKSEYDQKLFGGGSQRDPSPARRGDIPQRPVAASRNELYPPGFRPAGSADQSAPAPASAAVSPALSPVAASNYGMPAGMPAASLAAAQPLAGTASSIPLSAAGPVDPMAPVAIPGVHLPPMASGLPTAAPLAAMPMSATMPVSAMPLSAMPMPAATMAAPNHALGGIPVGGADVPMAAIPMAVPSAAANSGTADAGTPEVRKASAASFMMAARKERQTRRAALLAGGAAGLVVVAGLAAYVVVTSRLGRSESPLVADAKPKSNVDDRPSRKFEFPKTPATKVQGDVAPPATVLPTKDGVPEVTPPAPMPMPSPEPPTDPMPAEAPAPAPQPEPMPKPVARPTREQVAALEAALQQARLALSERSLEEAETEIDKAEKLAVLPEHQALVERLRLAIEHVKVFRQSLTEAVAKLEAAETIKVGSSTIVAIVETFPDKLTVQVNGSKRSYPLVDMPPGLAAAILDTKRVGGQPDNRLLKAMFVATRKGAGEQEFAQAREWLVEAQGSDDNADDLLTFLEDTYELVQEFEASQASAAAKTAGAE